MGDAALSAAAQVEVWDKNPAKWDGARGLWVQKGSEPLQRRIDGLSVSHGTILVVEGEVRVPIALVEGALRFRTLRGGSFRQLC